MEHDVEVFPQILLVEDNPVLLNLHRKMLEYLYYKPDIAICGEDVLLQDPSKYDIIFLDLGLPGISGIETAAKIRKREKNNKRVYIVALTAYIPDEITEKCKEAGIDLVKTKPIYVDEIQAICSEFISERKENSLVRSV